MRHTDGKKDMGKPIVYEGSWKRWVLRFGMILRDARVLISGIQALGKT